MEKISNTPGEIDSYVEILHKQLYFAVVKGKAITKLKSCLDTFFFTIDDELIYENYYCDFGPLNISCLYKYCCKLNKYLQYAKGLKSVVHYTCSHPDKKANASCLMGLFCVIYLKYHPKDLWKILQELGPYKPFLDASQYPCGFTLKIVDCLQAISKALLFNFFDFEDFNLAEYDLYNKLQYGDMNWIVPRKFLAFIGPATNQTAHPPEFYIKYFLKNDIKTVIRLNSAIYDPAVFTQVGIQHFDLIFPDGTTPPKDILLKFLNIAEIAPAAIAVHCKAGLGRTGSLIGAYIIKHYRMPAKEVIAWMRLCRPGSVIGQQQIWLEKIENWLWRLGNQYRACKYGESDKIPRHRYGIYSKQWPIEKEKIINEARNNIQRTFTKTQLENISKQNRISPSVDSISQNEKYQRCLRKLYPNKINAYKSVSKLLSTVHGMSNNDISHNIALSSAEPATTSPIYPNTFGGTYSDTLYRNKSKVVANQTYPLENEKYLQHSVGHPNIRSIAVGSDMASKKKEKSVIVHLTQGDKLNEIKAARYKIINKAFSNKSKYFPKEQKSASVSQTS